MSSDVGQQKSGTSSIGTPSGLEGGAAPAESQQTDLENVLETGAQQKGSLSSGLSGFHQQSSMGTNNSQLHSPNFSATTGTVPYESFEIDDATMMSGGGASWVNRINWLRGRRNRSPTADDGLGTGLSFGENNANSVYHGSVIQVDDGIFKADDTSLSNLGSDKRNPGSTAKVVTSLAHLTKTSPRSDEDSLADFDDSEWTPQDSSYGAAFPLCGCIPKRIRRLIEATMIGVTIFMLVYLVVTTSIKISSVHDKSSSHHSGKHSNSDMYSGGEIFLDDDRYVEAKPKYDDYVKPDYSKTDDDVDDAFHDDRVTNDDHSRY